MGGAEFHYVRRESGVETLAARGPLTEPVVVEVYMCVCRVRLKLYGAYTRGDRRRNRRLLVARLNRCSSPRRSPVVYTGSDFRGNRRRDDHRDSRPVCRLQAIVAATIAPCIRPIKLAQSSWKSDDLRRTAVVVRSITIIPVSYTHLTLPTILRV